MSGRKRALNRSVRVPARYVDSILSTQKNSDKNNGKCNNQEKGKSEMVKNQGGRKITMRIKVMGLRVCFMVT